MTVETPAQFQASSRQTLARITRALVRLQGSYLMAHNAALEKIVGDSAGKISTGERADPTATIVGDPRAQRLVGQAALRRTLENAPQKLAELENAANAIERSILKAMDRLDPRETFEPIRYPITVSQEQIAESLAAQERREGRGEASA